MNPSNMRALTTVIVAATLLVGCQRGGAEKTAAAEAARQAAQGKEKAGEAASASHEKDELKMSADEIATAGIVTAVLQGKEVSEQLTVTATIEANRDRYASVAPRVSGKVAKVMASLGDQVRQGQALASIDSIEAGEAQSAYSQAATEYGVTKAALDRATKLRADEIIPEKDFLRARADSAKAGAVLQAATERRRALGISQRGGHSSGEPSVFAVTAPFAGTVVEKKAVMGELAQPDKPLFAIADMSTVWIETHLFEKDLGRVKLGAPASVTVAAYPDRSFEGKVAYISSVMDRETRTVVARVEMPNAGGALKLGMFASAAIATGGAGSAKTLLLPDDAVVLIQGQPSAFVKDGDGFAARVVDLGEKLRGQVVLKNGIRPGETVVVKGAYALKARMLKSQISAD
jgi:cobalt-zinc-cadmium efflux system membrane fusion protein